MTGINLEKIVHASEFRFKATAMGIRAFVMKPIVMREIANTIRQVLDEK